MRLEEFEADAQGTRKRGQGYNEVPVLVEGGQEGEEGVGEEVVEFVA